VRIALDMTYANEEDWLKDASAKARAKVKAR
jgi:hypothetical protein